MAGDFNGDGFDDLAIGAPGETIGLIPDAGAVNVIYGTPTGLNTEGNQFWSQAGTADPPEAGDRFGAALAAGDFDNDGFDDLAIGIPGENVGPLSDAGAVAVLYGTASGLSFLGNQFWTQNAPGVLDGAELGDAFGRALAAGDFDSDGFDDLAIGVPFENVGIISDAGAVNVLYGTAANLSPLGNQFWTQDSFGIGDLAEPSDLFGFSLATGDFDNNGSDDLAIGVPFENVGTVSDAGAVNVIYGIAVTGLVFGGNDVWTQDVLGVLDVSEAGDQFGFSVAAGDFNGDSRDDLAVGIPLENIGVIADAGAVAVFYGTAVGLGTAGNQFWNQNSGAVDDIAETSDLFGRTVTTGDFNNDGRDDLAIGVPFENIGAVNDAGAVNVLYGGLVALTDAFDQFWSQASAGVLGVVEASDRFGSALAGGDFNGDGRADLAIGVSGEDVGALADAGAVNVLYGSRARLTDKGDQIWHQDSTDASGSILDSAEAGDLLGDALG